MSEQQVTRDERAETDLLSVDSLDVEFSVKNGTIRALRDVSMSLQTGETLGIVGESGSGKSTLALAIVRYLDNNATIPNGRIEFKGRDMYDLSKSELRNIRGKELAHVAQNASRSLNPSITIGSQIRETIELHQDLSGEDEAMDRVYEVLEQVNIPNPPEVAKRYPHELSGGQQQRALIAIGLSCNPDCLILDEPTTGLDVTTQAKLLDLIEELKNEYDVGIMLITHNLGVVSQIADRVNILYAGEMMEKGSVDEVFTSPANPYTQALLATTPELGVNKDLRPIPGQIPGLGEIPDGCIFADRCVFAAEECRTGDVPMETVSGSHETRCLRWETAIEDPIEIQTGTARTSSPGDVILEAENLVKHYDEGSFVQNLLGDHKPVKAVNDVDLTIREGETVGLVGESGCGKSTLGRTLLRLHDPTAGTVKYRGRDLADLSKPEIREFRSECQIIFQDPEASLNPRKRVQTVIERPLEMFSDMDAEERDARVSELLEQVNLDAGLKENYPHELSGGQQQRVAIARAFATNPALVVLDEPVSSLDVSVQASILNLLDDLRDEYNTSYLLISHDMGVIDAVTDRLAVMYLGEIVEHGTIREVLDPPYHPYTRALLSAIPSLDPHDEASRLRLEGDVPSARDPPSGCSFNTRCPQKIGDICEVEDPRLEPTDGTGEESNHVIACHLDEAEMSKPSDTILEDL
jgi:peptide/nickel transport system ATP-binding protein